MQSAVSSNFVVAQRYGITVTNFEMLAAMNSTVISDNLLNFCLMYVNEKHTKTTNLQLRRLNYTRILYMTTDFYRLLIAGEEESKGKLRSYTQSLGNIFTNYDYVLVPIPRGTAQECNVNVIDLNNKVFIFFFVFKDESELQ